MHLVDLVLSLAFLYYKRRASVSCTEIDRFERHQAGLNPLIQHDSELETMSAWLPGAQNTFGRTEHT